MKRKRITALMLGALLAAAPMATAQDEGGSAGSKLRARHAILQNFREGLDKLQRWDGFGSGSGHWTINQRMLDLEEEPFEKLLRSYGGLRAADFGYARGYLSIRQVAIAYFGPYLYQYVEDRPKSHLGGKTWLPYWNAWVVEDAQDYVDFIGAYEGDFEAKVALEQVGEINKGAWWISRYWYHKPFKKKLAVLQDQVHERIDNMNQKEINAWFKEVKVVEHLEFIGALTRGDRIDHYTQDFSIVELIERQR